MTTIEVYPSNLPGQPLERHQVPDSGTLHDWLTMSCPSYKPGPLQPICAFAGGVLLPPDSWASVRLAGQTLELRPNPQDGGISLWLLGGLLLGAVAVAVLLKPNIPSMKSSLGARGQELNVVDLKANQPRLNGVIPEVAGRYKVFPDYLCQPRRYFKDTKTQAVDAMLCIGQGEFDIDPDSIFIGETPLSSLGETATYTIFGPGETVSGAQSHRNWYNAPEVGASTGAAGLRLTPGVSGTPKVTASMYRIDGSSISLPTGAGVAPQDWEVSDVVSIVAKTRTVTVLDGGGTFPTLNRDKIRGYFADLGLVDLDLVLLYGTPSDDGRYRVATISSSNTQAGSASTIVGSRISSLTFAPQAYTNLFNPNTATIGFYLLPDRTSTANTFYDYSDFIAVTPGQTYRVTGTGYRFATYYNASLVLVTGGLDAGTSFTVPTGVYYVRITIYHSELNTVAMEWTAQPLSSSISFYVDSSNVILTQNYASASALVTAINAQLSGVVASQSGGVITLTESSPFSGLPIGLSGYFEQVFGASPAITTGIQTLSYDELTLDKWVTKQTGTDENGTPVYSSGWQNATSMSVGVFNNIDLQQPRVKSVTTTNAFGQTITTVEYTPTEYQITSLITGAIPGGTGVIGWQFQRLNPDGTDDASWAGFYSDTSTPLVTIEYDRSQVVGGWVGPFRATPSAEVAQVIEFDIFASSGLASINDEGNIGAITREFELQWRTEGGAWTSIPYSVNNASKDQLGWTFSITLPAPYTDIDVRIRRKGAESEALKILDRLEWYSLRVLLPAPTSYAGATTMAVTIQGSDKIAARTENQINAIVTRKLNGVATRSIDDWVRYVCSSVGYSSTDINATELDALGALWDSRGDYYDSVLIDQTTVKEELGQALRVGFSELTIDQGKIRPVRDQARTVFEHLYTPQNMLTMLKRSFTSYDPDDYDGVDVEYTSAITWEQEIVQCRLPGDTGIRVEKLRLDGIADRTRAWRVGMRQRRMQKYRRKSYSFETELDALNSRYLSYCALADDIPGYGQSALLASITPVTGGQLLASTEPLVWVVGESHVVALRRQDGTLSGPHAATRVDDYRLTIPSIDFVPTTGGAVEITHILFGTVSRWSYPALITEIVPSGDSVEVSAVNYDVRVYADDDNSPS